MQCEDKVETEHSLAKVHKVCRLIGIIVKIIFVVFCVCWLSTVLLMIYSLINPSELGAAEGVSVPRIALYFVHGFAVALIFVVFIGIFVDAVKGQSPFVMKQVKRLRLIAGLLAIYAIVDVVISGHIGLVQYAGLNSGYVSTCLLYTSSTRSARTSLSTTPSCRRSSPWPILRPTTTCWRWGPA